MRKKDNSKQEAIYHAALEIVVQEGLSHTSLSKIAKKARVGVSSIYTYFEHKQDMLEKIYIMSKTKKLAYLNDGLLLQKTIKKQHEHLINNLFRFLLENPIHCSFQKQCDLYPKLSEKTKQEVKEMAIDTPIHQFMINAKQQGYLRDISHEILQPFMFEPIFYLVQEHHNNEIQIDKKMILMVSDMIWTSLYHPPTKSKNKKI